VGRQITIQVNGQPYVIEADADAKLLEILRDDLGLTGTKYGCGESQCGACTVLVDGHATRSCVTPLSAVGSKPVLTIESLERGGELHPLQEAFVEESAMQCGFCVTGMIMTALELLRNNPKPSDNEIASAMEGNICRCCAYPQMLAAIKRAAQVMRGDV
jgi:aerobic-type carbon monoxide dehydrogenase small subunit (CoxS/CutS family)